MLGGYLTGHAFGWRWIFFINLPVGILAVIMTIIFLPRDAVRRPSAGETGSIGPASGCSPAGLACFQTMLEQGQEDDWFSSHFILLMAIGAVLGIGFFHLALS